MPGILTPASTGDAPAPPPAKPTPAPIPAPAQQNTLSMGNPLANIAGVQSAGAPAMHGNEAVNAALTNAFRPIIPDQINSLLGPAMGHIMSQSPPVAYYQPRPAAPVATRRSS